MNLHAPNNRPGKYVKQKVSESKGERESSVIVVGNFNTPLSLMDRTTRQKIVKEQKT